MLCHHRYLTKTPPPCPPPLKGEGECFRYSPCLPPLKGEGECFRYSPFPFREGGWGVRSVRKVRYLTDMQYQACDNTEKMLSDILLSEFYKEEVKNSSP